MNSHRPHLIVVGGGFAGLWCVRALAREAIDITLIDRSNHHLFQPLLYQVATGGLSAPAIAAPLRHILRRQQNVRVLMAEVDGIDRDARTVSLSSGESLSCDWLLVASGATHAYFGNDAWAPHAPGLKTLSDAMHCWFYDEQHFQYQRICDFGRFWWACKNRYRHIDPFWYEHLYR